VGALRRSTRSVGRFVAIVASTVTIVSSFALVGATHAVAAGADYDFLSDVNSTRQSHGLKPLTMVSDLHSVATNWSQHMASQGTISHNPNLQSQGGNWQEIGENVGVGPDENSIEQAFMNSSPHRANILNPDYTQVGIGTATGKDGRLYVTQDFRKPMGSSSSTSTSSGTTTHHSTTTHHRSTTTTTQSAPTKQYSAVAHPSTRRPAAAPVVRRPAPRAVPTLAARMATAAHAATGANDPVKQALAFIATMRAVAG
jgi:hypothetical protein